MKLKTYSITDYYKGIEIYSSVCTTSYKKASELLNTTLSHLRTYANCNDDSILEPNKVFSRRGMGGEIMYIIDHKNYLPHDEMLKIIDDHRLVCKTYQNTIDKYKNV